MGGPFVPLEGWSQDFHEQTEGGHGRIETRKVWCISDVQWLGTLGQDWPGLGSVAMVQAARQATTTECRYYISSLERRQVEHAIALAHACPRHACRGGPAY